MFINPKTAIAEGWLKFPEWMSDEFKEKCVQPNAIDVTIDRAFIQDVSSHIGFELSEHHKVMIPQQELAPLDGVFIIPPGGLVDVMSDFFVTVPVGMVASFIVRSTLNRNGLFITNGLYDQGFSNYCGMVLHNRSTLPAQIHKHTRIGQLYFVTAEDSGLMYNGVYNNNKHGHWSST